MIKLALITLAGAVVVYLAVEPAGGQGVGTGGAFVHGAFYREKLGNLTAISNILAYICQLKAH